MSLRKTRKTHQRQVILEEIKKVVSHPTADEIYEMVRERVPRVSLGTVYRNLETLSESGVIGKIELGGAQKRFDGNPEDHYHIRCVNCGRLDDILPRPLPDIENAFYNSCDYQVTGHQLMLTGLCPKCKETKSNTVCSFK